MTAAVQITKQTKIGLLHGGLSAEREVSLRSGQNCFNALKRLGYTNVELIDVQRDLAQVLKEKNIEVAFLALHGTYGEDGTVQGLLEFMQIPYTGSGVLASALAISKPLTKKILQSSGIPTTDYVVVAPREKSNLDTIADTISWLPLMVKPLAEGSSVGVQKVADKTQVKHIIASTLDEYGGAIIERYIEGQEITVGVLEEPASKRNGKDLLALPILELRPKSKAGFYDYEAKYTKGMTEFILPAELPEPVAALCRKTAIDTFRALGCSGYARVDMMVDKDGRPYVLEVNTLPGMTDTSDLPAMAQQHNIAYDELVERILHSASLHK